MARLRFLLARARASSTPSPGPGLALQSFPQVAAQGPYNNVLGPDDSFKPSAIGYNAAPISKLFWKMNNPTANVKDVKVDFLDANGNGIRATFRVQGTYDGWLVSGVSSYAQVGGGGAFYNFNSPIGPVNGSTASAMYVYYTGSQLQFFADDTLLGSYPAPAGLTFVRYDNRGWFPNVPISGVYYGANLRSLAIGSPTYDAFSRALTLPLEYSDVSVGVAPDYLEIQYNGGSWRPMAVVENSVPGSATAGDTVPPSITGVTVANVRWHNAPSIGAAFSANVTVPFAKMLGVNGGGLSTDVASGWEFWKDNNNPVYITGWSSYVDPGNAPWSADGLNGTVMRDAYGGIGRNSLGITTYHCRRLISVPVQINAYIDWAPGVQVSSKYGAGYPLDFAHNVSTGRSTFTLKADTQGTNQVELLVVANSIPAGTTVRPVVKDFAAPTVAPITAAYTQVAKGLRFLDNGGYNNPTNNTRTLTTLPIRTLANRTLGGGSFESQAADLVAVDASFAYGIFSHIDDVAFVTAHANYWAANTPGVTKTFFGTSNEQFNEIFFQVGDMRLAGLRAGFAAAGVTPGTAVLETVLDGQGFGLPSIVSPTDASGTATSGVYLKALINFTAGQKFYRNVGGGVPCLEFLNDVPIGGVFPRNSDSTNVRVRYGDNAVVIAGLRAHADLTVRNGNIAKARYAAAGKPPPEIVLEGFGEDFNWSLSALSWNNNYLSIDRVSLAPYFNNGASGGGGFMDYSDSTIWTPAAKAAINASDYAGALTIVFDSLLHGANGIDKYIAKAKNWSAALRAFCISKGLAADAINPIMYEMGDHNGFSGYNWTDNAKAAAFMAYFWSDPRSYTLFLYYLKGIGAVGCPAMFYAMGPGNRPFGLVKGANDVALTGTGTNYYYKAMKDVQDLIATLS